MIKKSKYFDEINNKLFNELVSYGYQISIKHRLKGSASVFTNEKKAIIYLNWLKQYPSTFAHELLHLKFKYDSGIEIGNLLYQCLPFDLESKGLIKKRLFSHLANTFEHIKIYDEYISMGYNSNEFLFDNNVNKLPIKDAIKLANRFCINGSYSKFSIDLYIGKLFSLKADISSEIDYSKQLNILEETDNELFEILNNLWNNWISFSFNEQDKSKNIKEFEVIAEKFYQRLFEWSENKIFMF